MRILEVEFANLASLKGKFHIDFTRLSSLFAITGPTGSGKSTILDAITLGLYGETSRLKVSQSVNEIMSKETGFCSSCVGFESNGKLYKSYFSQSRARQNPNGKLQAIERRIVDQNGDDFNLSRALDVQEKINEIVGFKFEQFTKAILLSQGKFSDFLKMGDAERSSILEKLTGTEIYSLISQRAFEMAKQKKLDYNRKLESLQNVKLLTEEEVLQITKSLEDNALELEITDRNLDDYRKQLALMAEKFNALKDVGKEEKSLKEAVYDKEAFAPNKALLDKARKAQKLQVLYNNYKASLKNCQNAVEEKASLSRKLRKELENLDELKKTIEGKSKALEEAALSLNTLKDMEPRVRSLDLRLNNNAIDMENLKASVTESEGQLRVLGNDIQAYQRRMDALVKARDNACSYLNEHSKHESLNSQSGLVISLAKELGNRRGNPSLWDGFEFLENSIKKLAMFVSDMRACMLGHRSLHRWPVVDDYESWHDKALELAGSLENSLNEVDVELKLRKLENLMRELDIEGTDESYINSLVKRYAEHKQSLGIYDNTYPGLCDELKRARLDMEQRQNHLSCLKDELKTKTSLNDVLVNERKGLFEGQLDMELRNRQRLLDSRRSDLDNLNKEYNRLNTDCARTRALEEKAAYLVQSTGVEASSNEKELLANIGGYGFKDTEDLESGFLGHDEIEALEKAYERVNTNIAAAEARLRKAQEQKSKYDGLTFDSDEEELRNKASEKEALHDYLNNQMTLARLGLEEDKKNRELYEKSKEELDKLDEIQRDYGELSSLIGSADGAKLRKFAQILNLEVLVQSANVHLKAMNTRYEITRSQDDDSLSLLVLDSYQGGLSRPSDNLSGGETFIISLALALGLSSLVSKGVTIDSLFLDEGFGTLDRQSLGQVLDALSNLNQKGRAIGIISHVDDVQNNIGCCIEVRSQDGIGSICLPY